VPKPTEIVYRITPKNDSPSRNDTVLFIASRVKAVRHFPVALSLMDICLKPLLQREAKCEAIDMKMTFCSHANKTHFCTKPRFASESSYNPEMAC